MPRCGRLTVDSYSPPSIHNTAIVVNNRLIPLGLDIFNGTHRAWIYVKNITRPVKKRRG